jgi:methylenetetrahydrofolate reductase (NADPH)
MHGVKGILMLQDNKKTGWSFEIFPPRRTASVSTIYCTLADLKKLKPDFISVTYGAGGASQGGQTVEIVNAVKNHYEMNAVAHMPCIALTRDEARNQLAAFKNVGVEKILALRGDLPADGNVPHGEFSHADDLIRFVRSLDDFSDFRIYAACYPEKHPDSPDWESDIRYLKQKVDSGVDGLITQLFFSNSLFYDFMDRIRNAGIDVPVEAGIMPVINSRQIERMVQLCRASLPEKFCCVMNRFSDNPEAMFEIGCAYAVDQIIDLVAHGVDGIHLYTMNNPAVATRIFESVRAVIGRN